MKDFDNFVTFFGYSMVTHFMSKIFVFSMVSSSSVIVFDYFIGLRRDIMLLLFGVLTVFYGLGIFVALFFKNSF